MDDSALTEELRHRLAAAEATISALRHSEQHCRALLEVIDQGVCVIEQMPPLPDGRRNYRCASINATMQRLFEVLDLTGQTTRDIFPDEVEGWYDDFDYVLQTGKPLRAERRFDPQRMALEVFVTRLEDGSGRRLLVTMLDVTRRQDAERALRQSEQRFRAFVTASAEIVYRMSPDWSKMYQLEGRSQRWSADKPGEAWLDQYVLPEDQPMVQAAVDEAIRTRTMFELEHRVIRADGEPGWTLSRAVPLLDARGETVEWLGAASDVTDRKAAETALADSEAKYRMLFETIDQGFYIAQVVQDSSGKAVDYFHVEVNPALGRVTGLPEIVGKFASEVVPNFESHWLDPYDRVLATGEPVHIEAYNQDTDRWYQAHHSRIGDGSNRLVAVLLDDITERKHAEESLRRRELHQTFLLKLSDVLRGQADERAIGDLAVRLLAEELELDRCSIIAILPGEDRADIEHQYSRPGTPAFPRSVRTSDFPTPLRELYTHTLVFADVTTEPTFTDLDRRSFAAVGFSAFIAPSVRHGEENPVWGLVAVSNAPRQWTADEVRLVEEAAERIWAAQQQARSDRALQQSEARFAQFSEASAAALWIRDAQTLRMEFASRAMANVYGVAQDSFIGDISLWAAIIVPEDRDGVLRRLDQARQGGTVVHQFRVRRPSDGVFRWIRSTNFPLLDERGRVQRIGGIAEDVTETRLASEHQTVLLAELQHRVRNIMAVIRSIVARTGGRAESVADYVGLMSGRLFALARVQALLTRAANVSVELATIIREEVSAQASHEEQCDFAGPPVALSPKAAEVLTLAVHELTTNALKYGALSVPEGKVTVRWEIFERGARTWVSFNWLETGGPRQPAEAAAARRRGFGTELIEGRIPYELKGTGRLLISAGGARCHLEFPLEERASILETDAPARATVFGGALDMTGEPDLTGRHILVVEDDYYLATDAARALESAGAKVLGPCGSEEIARGVLGEQRPDAVVLDLNLGRGASFAIADLLRESGIPFIFTTGYDQDVIPKRFDDIERLQKPVELRAIVQAVSRIVHVSA